MRLAAQITGFFRCMSMSVFAIQNFKIRGKTLPTYWNRTFLLLACQTQEKIYFLIDEMLRGTNSADKYLGSKAVIERLIAKKAVGIVATHDLQIAELEKQYPDYIRNFYFDIEVKNGEMLFDYKIKNGECKTFNASLLLEQIGIHVN